ncbi:Protein CBG11810 [Caenorhabditis briggsae]|uniref:Protein CBG11810 n=1 Tax=Caenorhabditis briggsae TaxID=6238 RepID=A8XE33_CAEBR|nr:Protein CBG11810 [Caenorhabditis briggsae]CAP30905.2 Protein CBG11810 [Caenorhabditis briggsae]
MDDLLEPPTSSNGMETSTLPQNPNESLVNELLNWEMPRPVQKETVSDDVEMKEVEDRKGAEKAEKAGGAERVEEGVATEAEKSTKISALRRKNGMIELKNSEIVEMKRINAILENEILDLPTDGNRLESPRRLDSTKVKEVTEEQSRLVSWLENMDIHALEDMEEIFRKTESIKKQKATLDELVNATETEKNWLQAQLTKQRQQWNEDKLKMRMLKWKSEFGRMRRKISGRWEIRNRILTRESTQGDAFPSGPSTRRRMPMEDKCHMQGECGNSEELGERRERPRMMMEDGNLSYGAHGDEGNMKKK